MSDASLEQRTKILINTYHRLPFKSYQEYIKTLDGYQKNIADIYQKIAQKDATLEEALAKMSDKDKGAFLGFVWSEYQNATHSKNAKQFINQGQAETKSGFFAWLSSMIVWMYYKTYNVVAGIFSSQSQEGKTPVWFCYHEQSMQHCAAAVGPSYARESAAFLPHKATAYINLRDADVKKISLMPTNSNVAQHTESDMPTMRVNMGPQHSSTHGFDSSTQRAMVGIWVSLHKNDGSQYDPVLARILSNEAALREFIYTNYKCYPEDLPHPAKVQLFGLFGAYESPAYMNMLCKISNSNAYFVDMATRVDVQQLPATLKSCLNGMTANDWSKALKAMVAWRNGLSESDYVRFIARDCLSLYRYQNFKQCMQQMPDFNNIMIDFALNANADFIEKMNKAVDADAGTVLKYVNQCLNNADLKTMQDYCAWKFGRQAQELSAQQKYQLFTNWAAWDSYSYIKFLQSFKDFDRFVMNIVHDKTVMNELRRHNALPGHGTVADHVRSLAKGAWDSYRGRWETFSQYNSQKTVQMHDLTPEERYGFYSDPIFYTDQEAAQYMQSYGHEYDVFIQRAAADLARDTALNGYLNTIYAYDGYTVAQHIEQQAHQAKQRIERYLQEATNQLAEQTDTLLYLKDQCLERAEHAASSLVTRERLLGRAQALESFIQGNHAISMRDYHITRQAKTIARNLGMNEYELQCFTGNVIQHQLHGELVALMNKGVSLYDLKTGAPIDATKILTQLSNECMGIVFAYNKIIKTAEHAEKAFALSDVCWGLIDNVCSAYMRDLRQAHDTAQSVYKTGEAITLGAVDGVKNVYHMLEHPVATVKAMAEGTGLIAGGLVKLIALSDNYADLNAQELIEIRQNIDRVIDAITEKTKDMTKYDVMRAGTAFATECALTERMLQAAGSFFKHAQSKAILLTEEIGTTLTKEAAVLQTVEGFEVKVAGDVAEQMCKMSAEGVAHGGAAKTVGKVPKISEDAVAALKNLPIAELSHEIGDLSKLEEAVKLFKDTQGFLHFDGPFDRVVRLGKKFSRPGDIIGARGSMYELEKALELVKAGEKIVSFGSKYPLINQKTLNTIGTFDIDIETACKFIECKKWDWGKIS